MSLYASIVGALGITPPIHMADGVLEAATTRGATVLPVAVFEVLSRQLWPHIISSFKRPRYPPNSNYLAKSDLLNKPTKTLIARGLKEFNSLDRRVRVLPAGTWTNLAVSVAKEYGFKRYWWEEQSDSDLPSSTFE